MAKGYVISDLHMMAAYSRSDRHWADIDRAASKAHFFVLNGDINEMYFSDLPFEQRMETGLGNIERLVKAHPNCQFHYIIGNHENIDAYMNGVVTLAHRLPNLQIHACYMRIGNALYLHGDQPLGAGEITTERHLHPAGGMKQQAAGNILPLVNPLQATFRNLRHAIHYSFNRDVNRILHAIDKADPIVRSGVEHVFFAHTHRPKLAVTSKHSPISFHNTGAGVRGAHFSMLEIETDDREHVVSVRQAHESPVHPRINQATPNTRSMT
jgi:UDP-2,3-diacylglucosamine hydrolase